MKECSHHSKTIFKWNFRSKLIGLKKTYFVQICVKSIKACPHQAKANIFFDVCRLFFDLFWLFFDPFCFVFAFARCEHALKAYRYCLCGTHQLTRGTTFQICGQWRRYELPLLGLRPYIRSLPLLNVRAFHLFEKQCKKYILKYRWLNRPIPYSTWKADI